jgi:hypothetical protein
MSERCPFKILPLAQVHADGSPIDVSAIREICEHGLDDCPPEDRAIAWLVLSGIFPPYPEHWESLRQRRKSEYFAFVAEFSLSDFHLNGTPNNAPNQKMMEHIHIDIIRSVHHIVFLPATDPPGEPADKLAPYLTQVRRLERMLYVFGSVVSTFAYLQGFNELICVAYCVLAQACPFFRGDDDEIEALTFFLFQELFAVTQLQELFNTQEDSTLIHRRLGLFMQLLKVHLPQSAAVLDQHQIHPLFFCFKWLPLLFAQDYDMPRLVLIWDALFAHFKELIEYAMYVAVAQVKMVEKRITLTDYKGTLTALQKLEIHDVPALLVIASQFWKKDHDLKGQKK